MNDKEKIKDLEERLAKAYSLLTRCFPYIETHYLRSRVTFGVEAKKIMDEIRELVYGN